MDIEDILKVSPYSNLLPSLGHLEESNPEDKTVEILMSAMKTPLTAVRGDKKAAMTAMLYKSTDTLETELH